jgi:hypothetical protein
MLTRSTGLDFRIVVETPDKAPGFVPDLDDPATLGCLLALVQEAWGPCWAAASMPDENMAWQVRGVIPRHDFEEGATQGQALVLALEAAPAPKATP